ncbi:histidine--tRNA ligase [Blattabacterium cuenoti]|uniref:histidine--tRNA ligase n=1 Tax=Blattabacterium cuenoti TaxID=1653831 RepID=UPI00163BF428|nr:histidine--tRNA ligase [Blattabacterium cuenoti]
MKYFDIPKGTRDFSSIEINNRNFIINIIQNQFELFGFQPIETPSFEKTSIINGNYGEEGNSLIFRILNSGDVLKKKISDFLKSIKNLDKQNISSNVSDILTQYVSDKVLRYDLTVPLIRYIVMYKKQILFPFKRYQIQPVWRADKPQKGRFREFYQCDSDIISFHPSLWEEIELIQLGNSIFTKLNLPIIIYINHIDVLKGLIEISGIQKKFWKQFIICLDKWNKIGQELVKKEMKSKGMSSKSLDKISHFLNMKTSFHEIYEDLYIAFENSNSGKKGIDELYFIFKMIKHVSRKHIKLKWSLSLSRGMNYYTGIIWEMVPDNDMNEYSIGGGGRYNLSHFFGKKNVSGTGFSLGLDRIYLSMVQNNLFKKNINFCSSKILFINFGHKEVLHAYSIINFLREKGISTQLYPNNIRIGKQFKYAKKQNIPFVIIIGKNEIKNNKIKVKYIKEQLEKEYNNIHDLLKDLF